MESTVKQRLREFIKYIGISERAFLRHCGLSQSYISTMRVSIQPDKVSKIAIQYPDLNTGWLLTGEGKMLKTPQYSVAHLEGPGHMIFDFSENHESNITDLNEKAKYLTDYKNEKGILKGAPLYADLPVSAGQYDIVSTSEIPTGYINLPNVSAKWFFPVIGCSMEPEICAGDTVGVNYVENRNLLDPDKIYMIITPHERMIKRLRPDNDDKDIIWAISTNYKEIKLYSDDIKAIYHVVYVMKGKLL